MRSATVRRRRLELGLARRDVAREVSVSEGAIARLERGGTADDWSLRHLRQLARALGTTVGELLEAEQDDGGSARTDDVRRLATVLGHCDRLISVRALAETLGWTMAHTNDVLVRLDEHSRDFGLRLQRLRGQVALRPAPCDDDLGRLHRREMAAAGMSRTHARTLHAVLTGAFDERRANANSRMSFAALLAADLVTEGPDGPLPSEAVRFALDVGFPESDHRTEHL